MENMGKQILITGAGRGKTMLASLLASHYASKGIPYQVADVGSKKEVEKLKPLEEGFQIVVSNFPVLDS
ncbi:MAG: hypothetical protein GX765_02455, partial [Candidatus Moranbacteria bacterium]|nr:hypothetical protein [Candidatus Moranbacteria bacterium]